VRTYTELFLSRPIFFFLKTFAEPYGFPMEREYLKANSTLGF